MQLSLRGAIRTLPGEVTSPWALLGLQVFLSTQQSWGRGKMGQLVESSFLCILRAVGHHLRHEHNRVVYEVFIKFTGSNCYSRPRRGDGKRPRSS